MQQEGQFQRSVSSVFILFLWCSGKLWIRYSLQLLFACLQLYILTSFEGNVRFLFGVRASEVRENIALSSGLHWKPVLTIRLPVTVSAVKEDLHE